ncbi:MAG: hypothetical protein A2020_10570 [Lentisphaerae bacterium GWF2_45_14]|nr:MAG: hypothetical protein A2020_10570 [Lentisphaerae bacterium GWF2_45_14]
MEHIFNVKLDSGAKYRARGKDDLNLKRMDLVVVRKDFYFDYGLVTDICGEFEEANEKEELPKIQRKVTVVDMSKANENVMRAKTALRTAHQHVERLKLPMKLLNAHYSFDCKLLTIQFTADGRVDFRQLVKDLSVALNTRIDLRQIGVRDETAIRGGLGICGRQLCCCSFLHDFKSINVRMAKEQDLSLTPSTISGACGRLKCCLKYEHEGYLDLEKTMPRRGDACECCEGRGRIVDRNLLTQKVVVELETGKTMSCSKDEVQVVYPEKYKIKKDDSDANYEELRKLED